MVTHDNVRSRGVLRLGSAAAALTAIALLAGGTSAAGQTETAGVSMSMKRSDQHLAYGEKVRVRGRVSTGADGRKVALQYAPRGRRFRTVKRTTTRSGGRYLLSASPSRNGKLRVQAQGARGSSTRPVAVEAAIAATPRRHVKRRKLALVRGTLRPGYSGREVRIQVRKGGKWRTVDAARTGKGGKFTGSWRATRAGRVTVRALFPGDNRNTASSARLGTVNVYRPAQASYYGPGLYGNRTACGQTLTPGTVGVAHKYLPCGTLITFRYKGNTARARVIDRGPFHASREWDLTAALKRRLGFGSTGTVWTTR